MRQARHVSDAAGIIEGDALESDLLRAVFVWPNPAFPPLLRINSALVTPGQRPAVMAWAVRAVALEMSLNTLRVDDVTQVEDA